MEQAFQKSVCNYLECAVREVRNQEQTQEIRLNEGMPDIGRVLSSWGQVIVRSKEWRSDSVAFSGGIMCWVMYIPEDGTDPRCAESWIPFQMEWDIPPDTREGKIRILPLLRFLDARSISARKMIVRAGLAVQAEAYTPAETELSMNDDTDGDIQFLKNAYPMRIRRESGEKTFHLDEDLTLPASCPLAEKLLMFSLRPEITEQRITGKRLVFKGNANLHILYRSEDGNLCGWDFELPFSQLINLEEDYEEEPQGEVVFCVTDLELDLDAEGHFRAKCGLLAQYMVSCRQLIPVLEDAYSLTREVTPRRETVNIPAILDVRQENIYGEQTIPQNAERIVDVEFLTDFPRIRRMGENLEVEIPGQFQVLYYGENGMLQGASHHWDGAFRMRADEDSQVSAIAWPRNRGQISQSNGQLLLKPDVILQMETWAQPSISQVTELEVGQPKTQDQNRPALILRRPGKATLWQIAKQSGTTIQAIREANGLTGEPGEDQILLIPVC